LVHRNSAARDWSVSFWEFGGFIDYLGDLKWMASGRDVQLAFGAGNDGVELRGRAFCDGGREHNLSAGLGQGGWIWCEQLEAKELAAGRRVGRRM
jgi:hypothetical protein